MRRSLYAETPQEFSQTKSEIMLVLRALYGLKELPALWHDELRRELVKPGLKPAQGFPCYTQMTGSFCLSTWMILRWHFISPTNTHLHVSFERDLVSLYNTKVMGDLVWFLGIRIACDKALKKTWLIQDAFIDKVCARFGIDAVRRAPDVPLTENWLPQSTENPNTAQTKLYQELVGPLAYIAVWGRPDVARTHVVFACHLTNPRQSHVSKLRQTWRYLLNTKALALGASASTPDTSEFFSGNPNYCDPLFFGSSDASYADTEHQNLILRASLVFCHFLTEYSLCNLK